MPDLPPIVGLLEANEALQDFVLCPMVFVPGCNMRCPYCLNTDVVLNTLRADPPYGAAKAYTFEQVVDFLRENEETHILISGGEPLLQPGLCEMVRRFCDMGLRVGISTNGTKIMALHAAIMAGVSMVAMDIKCDMTKAKMSALLGRSEEDVVWNIAEIHESIHYLNRLVGQKDFWIEFRTVSYPPLVDENSIRAIGGVLNPHAKWVLQQFRPRPGLLGGDKASAVQPYDDETLDKLLNVAKQHVADTILRWI